MKKTSKRRRIDFRAFTWAGHPDPKVTVYPVDFSQWFPSDPRRYGCVPVFQSRTGVLNYILGRKIDEKWKLILHPKVRIDWEKLERFEIEDENSIKETQKNIVFIYSDGLDWSGQVIPFSSRAFAFLVHWYYALPIDTRLDETMALSSYLDLCLRVYANHLIKLKPFWYLYDESVSQ